VFIGYVLFFLSIIGVTKSGSYGLGLFTILADILTRPGATLVFIAGIVVGNIVFFDTSMDEILQGASAIGKIFIKLFPRKGFSLGKGAKASVFDRNKPITIKGG